MEKTALFKPIPSNLDTVLLTIPMPPRFVNCLLILNLPHIYFTYSLHIPYIYHATILYLQKDKIVPFFHHYEFSILNSELSIVNCELSILNCEL